MPALPAYTVRTEMSALWRLSWPMLAGQLATVGMGVADVAMTGHVSAAELAAADATAAHRKSASLAGRFSMVVILDGEVAIVMLTTPVAPSPRTAML